MQFTADEGIDNIIVFSLRNIGYHVLYIKENHPGIADDEVLKIANERNDILITFDKDFGELVYRLKQIHNGIILIRLSGMTPEEKAKLVVEAIREHETEFTGAFTVINKTQIKIRK